MKTKETEKKKEKKEKYEDTLNLPKKQLYLNNDKKLMTDFFIKKLTDADQYQFYLEKNKKSELNAYISKLPVHINIDSNSSLILENIIKDTITRYMLIKGYKVDNDIIFSYIAGSSDERYKMLYEIMKKEVDNIAKSGNIISGKTKINTTYDKEYIYRMYDRFLELYKVGKIVNKKVPTKVCVRCNEEMAISTKQSIPVYKIIYKIAEDNDYLFSTYSNLAHTYVVVSTKAPWTLVNSEYIAFQKDQKYSLVEFSLVPNIKTHYVIMSSLVKEYMDKSFIKEYKVLREYDSNDFKNIVLKNSLDYTKKVKCILTSQKLKDIKTSAITVNPAHSMLEYIIYKENGLNNIRNCIEKDGKICNYINTYRYKDYQEVNNEIVKYLYYGDYIIYKEYEDVQVTKCKKCHNIQVYRYLTSWYMKQNSNEDEVNNMIETKYRSHTKFKRNNKKLLKISSQNQHGVIVPALECGACGEKITNDAVVDWFKKNVIEEEFKNRNKIFPEEQLGSNNLCKCESDLYFFEEGSLNYNFELLCSDVLKENSKNILVTNIDTLNRALNICYYSVEFLEKMSKIDEMYICGIVDKDIKKLADFDTIGSLNVGLDIYDVIYKYNSDILRLWAIHKANVLNLKIDDIKIKEEQLMYDVLRRTMNYITSNLYDFNSKHHYIEITERYDQDKYIYMCILQLYKELEELFTKFDFYKAYMKIRKFCKKKLCREYFNSIKYNLYVLNENDKRRRATQSTLLDILKLFNLYLNPLIPLIFIEYLNTKQKDLDKITDFDFKDYDFKEEYHKWDKIYEFKRKLNKKINKAIEAKTVENTFQICLKIEGNQKLVDFLSENKEDFLRTLNISELELELSEKQKITISKSRGTLCIRCHNYKNDVGMHKKYVDICVNCAEILENK